MNSFRGMNRRFYVKSVLLAAFFFAAGVTRGIAETDAPHLSGTVYTNYHTREPWSIHVVKIDRSTAHVALLSLHADDAALGVSSLSEQLGRLKSSAGRPIAAINGDFFKRDSALAGDPRGLQITDGDLLSAPNGNAVLWVDAVGEPHAEDVVSRFTVTFPNGTSIPVGLNEHCENGKAVLYTPKFVVPISGKGAELELKPEGTTSLVPLHVGRKYTVLIAANRTPAGRTVPAGELVLRLSPPLAATAGTLTEGAKLEISTLTFPALRGVKTALGGGPVLLKDGKRQKLSGEDSDSFQVSSMFERHPRSAFGWNEHAFFFVEVDGRQRSLSVGMTLDELSRFLLSIGCENAINFDGGGSSTLWYAGKVRNSPCDRREREIANSLVAVAEPNAP